MILGGTETCSHYFIKKLELLFSIILKRKMLLWNLFLKYF